MVYVRQGFCSDLFLVSMAKGRNAKPNSNQSVFSLGFRFWGLGFSVYGFGVRASVLSRLPEKHSGLVSHQQRLSTGVQDAPSNPNRCTLNPNASSKISRTFWGVPIVRVIVVWGVYWGPQISGQRPYPKPKLLYPGGLIWHEAIRGKAPWGLLG